MVEEASSATATEGPCRGHLCDGCAVCRRGRCCRRDRPDYRLPALGEWEGPIFGRLGVLSVEDGKLVCHACGRAFRSLAAHASRKHGLLADEYRAVFGLRARTKLWSADLKALASDSHRPTLSRYWGGSGVAVLPPEERSRYSRGRRWALESLQDPHNAEARKEAGRRGSTTQQRRMAEGTLVRGQPKARDPQAARARAEERLRELWQDPDWRARTIGHIKAGQRRAGLRDRSEGPAPRPCIVCGTPFVSRTGRKTCSDACEDARRRSPRRGRKPTTCPRCGTSFVSSTGRRYCSDECARMAQQARPQRPTSDDTRQKISEARTQRRLQKAPAIAAALARSGGAVLSVRDRELVARFYGVGEERPWSLALLEATYHLTEGGVHRAVRLAVQRILAS